MTATLPDVEITEHVDVQGVIPCETEVPAGNPCRRAADFRVIYQCTAGHRAPIHNCAGHVDDVVTMVESGRAWCDAHPAPQHGVFVVAVLKL